MIFLLTINYNSSYLIQKLIASLPDHSQVSHKLIIVNNSKEDVGLNSLENESVSIIHSPKNLGFGSACNLGIRSVFEIERNAIIWIINPDAYLPPVHFKDIVEFFNTHSDLSILGTIVYTLQGKIWFAGGRFFPDQGSIVQTDLLSQSDRDYVSCDWVSGCSLLLNLKNFRSCPYFDHNYFLYYEDLDFCKRYTQQGHQVGITKRFGVIHQPSSITNRNIFNKIKHSTYSYLLTLHKYSPRTIQTIRLIKLWLYAIILILFKPQVSLGKITGIIYYFNNLP